MTSAEVDTSIGVHAGAADPHTGYQKESEKDGASGYAGLTAGSKIQNDAVVTASITDANVTLAKIVNVAADKLIGRGNGAGAGVSQEITLGTNLSMSGTTLNAGSGAYQGYSSTDTLAAGVEFASLSGASFTLTLPTAVGASGRVVSILHQGTSLTQVYTIATTSSQTIAASDGTTTSFILYTNGETLRIVSNGSNWVVTDHVAETPWVDAGAMTITGTGSNPTKPTTPDLDKVYWKRSGIMAFLMYRFQTSSNAGAATGTGNYLFALPTNLAFASPITPVATAISLTTLSEATSSKIGGSGVSATDPSAYSATFFYAYDTTHFEAFFETISAVGPVGNDAGFQLTIAELSYHYDLQAPMANWRA